MLYLTVYHRDGRQRVRYRHAGSYGAALIRARRLGADLPKAERVQVESGDTIYAAFDARGRIDGPGRKSRMGA